METDFLKKGGFFMSVVKFKRKPSELDYVENSWEIEVRVMNLCSKLSARWARIYQQPIDRLSCLQFDFVNMASSINVTCAQDYYARKILLKFSRACLQALEKRITDMVRVLYDNPSKCFNRKNGKNYTFKEATIMLDKKLEYLGTIYSRQYDLIKGVLASDKRRYSKFDKEKIDDREIINLLVSKIIFILFE